MLQKAVRFLKRQQALSRINLSLSRAATTSQLRNIHPKKPNSWEFAGFSQNGEDGISDYLTQNLLCPNRYFFEIGAADGLENNTSWFAIAKKYSGLMIEGDKKLSKRLDQLISGFNLGVTVQQQFVTIDNIPQLVDSLQYKDPDLFSLDIDGNDYYILKALLEHKFKPKIIIVEYNSAYGPDKAQTIPYDESFYYLDAHASGLYYGVSIQAWKNLLSPENYQFITVDENGVNAIFVDKTAFAPEFLAGMKPKFFAENFYQFKKYGSWEKQYQKICNLPLKEIKNIKDTAA